MAIGDDRRCLFSQRSRRRVVSKRKICAGQFRLRRGGEAGLAKSLKSVHGSAQQPTCRCSITQIQDRHAFLAIAPGKAARPANSPTERTCLNNPVSRRGGLVHDALSTSASKKTLRHFL